MSNAYGGPLRGPRLSEGRVHLCTRADRFPHGTSSRGGVSVAAKPATSPDCRGDGSAVAPAIRGPHRSASAGADRRPFGESPPSDRVVSDDPASSRPRHGAAAARLPSRPSSAAGTDRTRITESESAKKGGATGPTAAVLDSRRGDPRDAGPGRTRNSARPGKGPPSASSGRDPAGTPRRESSDLGSGETTR